MYNLERIGHFCKRGETSRVLTHPGSLQSECHSLQSCKCWQITDWGNRKLAITWKFPFCRLLENVVRSWVRERELLPGCFLSLVFSHEALVPNPTVTLQAGVGHAGQSSCHHMYNQCTIGQIKQSISLYSASSTTRIHQHLQRLQSCACTFHAGSPTMQGLQKNCLLKGI